MKRIVDAKHANDFIGTIIRGRNVILQDYRVIGQPGKIGGIEKQLGLLLSIASGTLNEIFNIQAC